MFLCWEKLILMQICEIDKRIGEEKMKAVMFADDLMEWEYKEEQV